MKTLLVGSGAVGGLTAAFLSKGGAELTLLCPREETARIIRETGLHITGRRGDIHHQMEAVSSARELTGPYDHILLAVKAYDVERALQEVLPFLKPDGLVTAMQGGMSLDAVSKIAGEKRTAACIVGWSCTMTGEAELCFTGEGFFIIGRADNKKDRRIKELQELLQFAAPVVLSENIREDLYAKLVLSSVVNGLGALCGEPLREWNGDKTARRLMTELVRENIEIAKAMRLHIPPYGGRIDYYVFANGDGMGARLRRNLLIRHLAGRYRSWTSSDLAGLKRGRQTEIPWLNGWLSETALRVRVLSPVNDTICKMVREIENGTRQTGKENLLELWESLQKRK